VPIPGTTKLHRLEENFGGIELELTTDDLDAINAESSNFQVQGKAIEHISAPTIWLGGPAADKFALNDLGFHA
jgi:diketogulonate reductase-like aldo/keto reductase